jgi:hypothetical protein
VSKTGLYNILKREGFNHRIYRLFYAQKHSSISVERKEAYIVHDTTYLKIDSLFRYLGTIKRLGRICQQTGADAYSSFGFAKILLVYSMLAIPLDNILTNNGKKCTAH